VEIGLDPLESGWAEYDQKGKKKADSAPVESTIGKITLAK
jgi:hypothetical protein